MFFCILFDYTILRDTKDVLVVTAPKSGAEIIPFLKTYVNLPGAIGFTVLYSKLTNKYSRETVFYGIVSTFLAFFALFATVIYPCQGYLHPHAFADWLAALLPAGFAAPACPPYPLLRRPPPPAIPTLIPRFSFDTSKTPCWILS